jgi:competence protein ComEA
VKRRACLTLLLIGAKAGAQPPDLDANTASRAQLESLQGIGPALADSLLQARSQQAFKDWADLRRRVRGLGPKLAARLSAQGLRVNSEPFGPSDG